MPSKTTLIIFCGAILGTCFVVVVALYAPSYAYRPEWNRHTGTNPVRCDVTQGSNSVRCGADLWFMNEVMIDTNKTIHDFPEKTPLSCRHGGKRLLICRSNNAGPGLFPGLASFI